MTDLELLEKSCWLWPACSMELKNCHARFRRDFTLEEVPQEAPLLISADQFYRLFINGQYVCGGPARGYPWCMPYDKVEVSRYLRKGHNWLAIWAHNPGKSTYSYYFGGKAGVIVAARWADGTELHSEEKDWWIRRSPGHNPDVSQVSGQLGYQEDFDCSLDDESWLYDEHAVLAPPASYLDTRSVASVFGSTPHITLEPREIPLLDERLCPPGALVARGTGTAAAGYRLTRNAIWFFSDHEACSMNWEEPGEFRTEGDALVFEISASSPGKLRSVTVDLGPEYLTGRLALQLQGTSAANILDIHFHNRFENGQPEYMTPRVGSLVAMGNRMRLADGCSRHEFLQPIGCRYFTLVLRENSHPVQVRATWRAFVYPMDVTGNFRCSDPLLNDISRICRHTQRVCAMDTFVDTPWREQAQWWGDARVQSHNTNFLCGDSRIFARGLRVLAAQPNPYGLTWAHAPSTPSGCVLPDYSLTWIVTNYDLYWETGRLDHVAGNLPKIEEILEYFRSRRDGDTGTFKDDPRLWLFEDWGPLPKTGSPAFLALSYIYTLQIYRQLRLACGHRKAADMLEKEIQSCQRRVISAYYDQGSGLMRAQAQGDAAPIVHDQVWAMLTGLPVDYQPMLDKLILPCLKGSLPAEVIQPTSFWSTYLLDLAQRLGLVEEALGYIRRHWQPMLPFSTTSEGFEHHFGSQSSVNHAWSAHPLTHIPELLCGLVQTAPAWRELELRPFAKGTVSEAELTMPTPSGRLRFAWRRLDGKIHCEVHIPAGVKATIHLPDGSSVATDGAAFLKDWSAALN
ncbi:MAG: hypothetical protein IJJ33_16480 [Victivallales bacterium]|nr:hypothetical protein [Victivallales bacterium]